MADKREKSREVRLGLVMYGGVSLAIYINGVAQEFYRAVRGRGVYKLIKALTDSDIVVDILSGTSAGGINGIYLAYALCNEKEFSAFSSLWRNSADIGLLLRNYKKPPEETPSVLDSEGVYHKYLEDAFSTMAKCNPSATEDVSNFKELDLFITGTDVDGNVSTVFDAAGHPIDVKDHRTVFVLKHRRGRKEPLNPDFSSDKQSVPNPDITHTALATLARITSSFPGAFSPVLVDYREPGDQTVEGKLQMWGKIGKKAYFLDGGVLDNKPFTHTIREIFYRLPDREVDRKLFYVEPDPERFSKKVDTVQPNIFQTIISSVIGIPSYESICEDLKLLSDHNGKVEAYNRFTQLLEKGSRESIPPVTMAFIDWFKAWEQGSRDTGDPGSPQSCAYRMSLLTSFRRSVLKAVSGQRNSEIILGKDAEEFSKKLNDAFWQIMGTGAPLLANFDIQFRLRRLFHVGYACYDLMFKKEFDNDESAHSQTIVNLLEPVLHGVNRQIKLLEVLSSAMEELFENMPSPQNEESCTEFWGNVVCALQHLTNSKDTEDDLLPPGYRDKWTRKENSSTWLPQKEITAFNLSLKKRVSGIRQHLLDGNLSPLAEDDFESIVHLTDACERRMLKSLLEDIPDLSQVKTIRSFSKSYEDFILIDAELLPLQLFAGTGEKDVIETVRISPVDAQMGFSCRRPEDKVSGDVMAHFGGFFKKSWRSNDILWGRLDSLCQLTETLLDRKRIEKVMRSDMIREDIRNRLQGDLAPSVLFSSSPKEKQNLLGAWLGQLVSKNPEGIRAPVDYQDGLELLIEAAQLELLKKDAPEVIRDAIEEQGRWNQYRTVKNKDTPRPGYDAGKASFYSGEGDLDPLVISMASKALAEQSLEKYRQDDGQSDIGDFFRNEYNVGKESLLNDIPPLVLLGILSKTLLVVRNCVLGALGHRSQKVRQNRLYKFVNIFLLLFHWIVTYLRRTSRDTMKFLAISISLFSVFALCVGLGWWSEIIKPPGKPCNTVWFAIFILVPLSILLSQAISLYFRFRKEQRKDKDAIMKRGDQSVKE